MVVSEEISNLLDRAKVQMMRKANAAFYTTIVLSLKFVWDDSQPTAYTDGTTIGFNTSFFKSMSADERVGVIVHEAMHVAYMHMDRLNSRNQSIFNQAADHVINLQLLAADFKLPAIRLADERFRGMGTEQVYDILLKEEEERKQKGEPAPGIPPMCDDIRPSQKSTPELEKHVQDILVRARIVSQMRGDKPGSIPGDLEVFLERLLNPKLPWTTILRRYLTSFSKSDYSWKKPNRRYFPNYHLPSMYGESLMDLTIAVDISGSVSDSDFLRFISEIASIFRMMKPKKITLIQFDTAISSIDTVSNLQELMKVKFVGRGGTCLECVFNHIEKHPTKLLMVFTDGGFRFRRDKFKTNTLWLIHDNERWPEAPFGKTIHYEMKEAA